MLILCLLPMDLAAAYFFFPLAGFCRMAPVPQLY
jgi:hypothetical protein